MDEDFYFEESNPKKVAFTIIFIVLVILGGGYYFYHKYQTEVITLKTVTVELGNKLSENINDYASGNIDGYSLDLSKVHVDSNGQTDSVGEYSYKIINSTDIKKGKIIVKDTIKPVVETQDLTVGVNEIFEPNEFLTKCSDLSLPCKVTYSKESDANLNKTAGEYNISIVISDNAGNSLTKDVKLIVSSTETLLGIKTSDFNVSYTSPKDSDWNNTFTYKFPKAVLDDSEEEQKEISDLSIADYQGKYDKKIAKQSIIAIYNKYDYVIGFSVKLTFEDSTIIFVTE